MKVSVEGTTITITGNIKSPGDFQEIKSAVEGMLFKGPYLHFELHDCMSMTSSVIGYLNSMIHKEGAVVSMTVYDERLYELLKDMKLIRPFNVNKR